MKYAVMSDIHGNFEAFSAVLDYLSSKNIDSYIICGDIIGYGPQPTECIEQVKKLPNLNVVMGNHDAVIAGKIEIKWFNEYARKTLEITKQVLSQESIHWIEKLPLKIETQKYVVVHGSPRNPLKEYLLSEMQYLDNVKNINTEVVFYGHTHIPMYFCLNADGKVEGDFIKPFARIKIKECSKFFINPGSVGQPRDGNSMASFAIFDDETMIFELIRVNYNIKKVQDLMKEMGAHQLLIERLEMGY